MLLLQTQNPPVWLILKQLYDLASVASNLDLYLLSVVDLGEGPRGPISAPPPFGGIFAKDLWKNNWNEHSKAILRDFGHPISRIL